jgi:hypothetical protein
MADSLESPPQHFLATWKRAGGSLRRCLAEYEERSIRALISRHDAKSSERVLAVWKLRKTGGNWRSLILTSEAIYDATLSHRSCKRRCHLATVRAITASTVSGQFLIHIDDTYDALYVHRKNKEAAIDGIVQAAANFRTVEVSLVKDADLTLIRLRSNAWLDQSSNKSQDQLGLLGSTHILRLLKRWSIGARGGGMESVQLTVAAQKLSARGAAGPRKLLLTQRALYILQGSTCQRRLSLKKLGMVSLAVPTDGRVSHAERIAQIAERAAASQQSQFALHMIDEEDAVFVCAERNGLLRHLSRHWAACHHGTPLPLALVAQAQLHVLLQLRTPRLRAPRPAESGRQGECARG